MQVLAQVRVLKEQPPEPAIVASERVDAVPASLRTVSAGDGGINHEKSITWGQAGAAFAVEPSDRRVCSAGSARDMSFLHWGRPLC
jgi:hypothetical protein